MIGNTNKSPTTDASTNVPGKGKKHGAQFSSQANKRIEELFSDLDQTPLAPRDTPAIEKSTTVEVSGAPALTGPPSSAHTDLLPGISPSVATTTPEIALALQEPSLLQEIMEENPQRHWSEDELLLIEQVTDQLKLALENAQLFEQTQMARDALQISVRYQKSVAQAVADLTERGFAAITDVLQLLGEAAQVSRAYYMESQVDFRGPYWHQVSEWYAPGIASQINNPSMRRLAARWLAPWIERLKTEGYIATSITALPAEEREFYESLGVRSILQFPVALGAAQLETPGCMTFEQTDYERTWTSDEIAALQTAASALANTIVRENLFNQLQVNLSETEAQYQASAQINSANSFDEILDILRQFSILGHINASNVSINLFDHPWTRAHKPGWLIPVSHWSSKSADDVSSERIPLGDWKTTESQSATALLSPDRPTVVFDLASDPRLDTTTRSLYIDKMGAKSLINVPLNVSGRWIGQIIALYYQTTGFTDREIRRLGSLAGQAAVAVESLRLLEETRQRNEELLAMNQITSSVSRTLELDQVLSEILVRVLAITEFDSGLVSIADPDTRRIRLAVQQQLPSDMIQQLTEKGMAGTTCDLIYQTGQTVYIPDLHHLSEDLEQLAPLLPNTWPHQGVRPSFEEPKALGFLSYIGVPLVSKGAQLGTICLFSQVTRPTEPARIALIEAIGQQVGVAVENARLFQSTQIALGETETLYQASSELNAVKTFDDILPPLHKYTILGKADKLLSIFLFSTPWNKKDDLVSTSSDFPPTGEAETAIQRNMPEWVIPIARRMSDNDDALSPESLQPRYPLIGFPAMQLLSPLEPTILEDILNDARLDDEAQKHFLENFQARGAIFTPLYVGGLWIGFILGAYGTPAHFDDLEIRRLSALSSQAAIAVQNLNSIELAEQRAREAQRRSQELALINNIVSAVSGSLDLQQGLDIVSHELARAVKSFAAIALLNQERQELKVVSNARAGIDAPSTIGLEIPLAGNPSYQKAIDTRKLVIASRPRRARNTGPLHEALRDTGANRQLIIPLVGANEVIGTVELAILEERDFSSDEIRLAESIVLQAATAIQNARLFEQTQAVLQETDALYQASASFQSAKSYDDILNILRSFTVMGKQPRSVSVILYERGPSLRRHSGQLGISTRNTLVTHWESPSNDAWLDRVNIAELPIIGETGPLQLDAVIAIENTQSDPRLDQKLRAMFTQVYHVQSAIFAPLVAAGQRIGHVSGFYENKTAFNEDEIRRLSALAGQAAVAIQNLRLLEESRRRASQLQTAAEIARDTSSTLALDNLLQRSVSLITERFGYYHASIFLLDENGREAIIRESTGTAGEEMKRRGHRLAVGSQSVIGQATATGKAQVLNDVSAEEARGIHKPNPLLPLTRAELGIPLKIGDLVIGALDVQSDKTNVFSEDDISVLQILADQITVAMDNARSYEIAQKAVEEIREADRLKTQFLANMSHELRTPLNSIIGFSRVILKGIDGPVTDQQTQDLNAIYNSGQHLLGLINDVLDVSRIEAGKMDLAFEENVNLGDIIRSVMSTTVGLVKDKPIELKQKVEADLPLITLDPMKIRQVLINLLSNSAKFTEQGSISVEAHKHSGLNGEPQVMVRISDTGSGIALEDQARLFQPFSQVDGSLTRKTGGSGLGLSICAHLIHLHHGQIGLDSEIGRGSTFFFILPVYQPAMPEIPAATRPAEKPAQPVASQESEQVIYLGPAESKAELQKTPPPLQPVAPELNPAASLHQAAMTEPMQELIPADIAASPAEQAVISFVPAPPYSPVPSKPSTILAIDQDSRVVGLYRRYLANKDYSIVSLTNLQEALTVARGLQPFAITLDVAMGRSAADISRTRGRLSLTQKAEQLPGASTELDGWKVLEALKSDPTTRHIPVIICTVLAEEEKGYKLGAVDYLMKPILEEELLQSIVYLEALQRQSQSETKQPEKP